MNTEYNHNNNISINNYENFEQAYNLCDMEFSHDNLLEMLKNGNISQKQIAALKFDYINTEADALALLNNLTGCDGKIREAVAYKINYFLSSENHVRQIFSKISAKTFADASIDINANICRLVIDSSILMKEFGEFSSEYTNNIVSFTLDSLEELDKFIFRDKKYVINKQLFKLYWCLEALSYFYNYADKNILEEIVRKAITQKEYTIREKVAQLLIFSSLYPNYANLLKKDENYYVRQVFLNH